MIKNFQPGEKVRRVLELLREGGARDCLFVGGFVRDLLLGIPSKDVDIEIYGLTYREILKILRPHFHVGLVGQSFGTVKVDNEIDLSLPRIESKSGVGHKGFEVSSDPHLDPLTAFSRRDFTINAIGLRLDGGVFDPFGGIDDLKQGVLRAPTEAFCEDPLRVLRGMQFAARFGFEMEPETVELCKRVRPEFETLSAERIWSEWQKWAAKGRFPGKGLWLLKETRWIDCFPEIAALVGVEQNPRFHPEGDVFTHTALACDAAVQIADGMELGEEDRCVLLFAALCHDFGKPAATYRDEEGNWRSPNHAMEGIEPTRSFFENMKAPNRVSEHVIPLVREHMAHMVIPKGVEPSPASVRRLALRLDPSNIRIWSALCRSDAIGCGGEKKYYRNESWEEIARSLELRDQKPKPILLGRHLMERGIEPGPGMGDVLRRAFEAQLDGDFTTLDGALAWFEANTSAQ